MNLFSGSKTQSFNVVDTKENSWVRFIHLPFWKPVSIRSILILSCSVLLSLPSGCFPRRCCTKILNVFLFSQSYVLLVYQKGGFLFRDVKGQFYMVGAVLCLRMWWRFRYKRFCTFYGCDGGSVIKDSALVYGCDGGSVTKDAALCLRMWWRFRYKRCCTLFTGVMAVPLERMLHFVYGYNGGSVTNVLFFVYRCDGDSVANRDLWGRLQRDSCMSGSDRALFGGYVRMALTHKARGIYEWQHNCMAT